jgi:hypothetical protein
MNVTRGISYMTWPNDKMTCGSTNERWLYRCLHGEVTGLDGS